MPSNGIWRTLSGIRRSTGGSAGYQTPHRQVESRSYGLVELIDSFFLDKYKNVKVLPDATINTESPAWAIDRLSILTLKIYHMREEANRPDATAEHKARCEQKLAVLLEQKKDLSMALDQLLSDIRDGKKYMKVYKQMKMYNDPALNPVLYGKK